jgi:hypothetical protein
VIHPSVARPFRDRLRVPPTPSSVPGSLPVLFFGDLLTAGAVTVGLNPSAQEYLDPRGDLLTGDGQRFATLRSLGARSRTGLTDGQCAEAVRRMRNYFDPARPVYNRWFAAHSQVLGGLGLSFARREVAHLDLVQEPTAPAWGALPPAERTELLDRDLPFLTWQLRTFPIRTVICTGSTVGRHVQAALDVTVTTEDQLERLTWWAGHATVDDRRIGVVGWNIPLARPTGLDRAGQHELGHRLAKALTD